MIAKKIIFIPVWDLDKLVYSSNGLNLGDPGLAKKKRKRGGDSGLVVL